VVAPPDATAAAPPAAAGTIASLALALQAVIYTYDGWYSMAYFGEEVREPGRDIPRALFGAVAAVTVLYLLFNVALLRLLPLAALAAAKLPAAAAAGAVWGEGERIAAALVLLSMLGALSATLLGTPRVLYAMGRDGLGFRAAAHVDAGGTPVVATLFTTAASLAFIWSGPLISVLGSLSVLVVAVYSSFYLALFALRRREPDTPRPYRAWGHPFTTGLGFAASLAFLGASVAGSPRRTLLAGAVMVASYPLYRLVTRAAPRPPAP
jgi:APA family basic amino acid/polyamine antiporter